jgi:hypothetical protein
VLLATFPTFIHVQQLLDVTLDFHDRALDRVQRILQIQEPFALRTSKRK